MLRWRQSSGAGYALVKCELAMFKPEAEERASVPHRPTDESRKNSPEPLANRFRRIVILSNREEQQ